MHTEATLVLLWSRVNIKRLLNVGLYQSFTLKIGVLWKLMPKIKKPQ